MYLLRILAVGLLCLAIAAPGFAGDAADQTSKGDLSFRLPSIDGKIVEFSADSPQRLTVVCFLGTECPLVRLYGPRLNAFAEGLKDHQVAFIGVNSNLQDSLEDVRDYARKYGVRFPMAKDYGNLVADRYGAKRTPEVFVIDQQMQIRYRGRIDDQYLPGQSRPKATNNDLRTGLGELLAGKPVTTPVTDANGCLIGREKKSDVSTSLTFTKHVSRLLNRHCVECHRPGEIGPFSLTDYDEVIGWADMMLETIDDGRMPPWHANPAHGKFTNAREMPEADKQALRDWVEGGMPYGDVQELPKTPKFTDGWLLPREPDLVVEMRNRPFRVPADGTVEYQYFVVDPGFEEDKWVTAAQVIPGNRAVVHHAIVFIRPPDGSEFRGIGWLSAYVPGQRSTELPKHRARKVPAGSKLVFQMHYTPNGTEQEDITKIGLVFGKDEEITHEVHTLVGIDQDFEIPPHAADFAVEGRVPRLPAKGELLAIAPHMHLRGKSFNLKCDRADGCEILLDVPQYDFNWQHIYELAEPLPLPGIKALEFTISFDNSENNPANPDPSQFVMWGDQTWEEMAIAFFEVAVPRDTEGVWESSKPKAEQNAADKDKKVAEFVQRFLKQFDENQNGIVEWKETPLSFQRFGFRRIDSNKDKQITTTEIEAAARKRKSL